MDFKKYNPAEHKSLHEYMLVVQDLLRVLKQPHQQFSWPYPFAILKLSTSALLHPHQILVCSWKVTSGWLSAVSFCSLATVQLHNVFEPSTDVHEGLCYSKTSASNFGTA